MRPLGEEQVALLAEEHQHGAGGGQGVLRGDESGQVVGSDLACGSRDRLEPVGDHPPVPRYFSAAVATSCTDVIGTASRCTTRPEASMYAVNGSPGMRGIGFLPARTPAWSVTSG